MSTEKVQHEYGADEIQILEGLEAVRKRPGKDQALAYQRLQTGERR